jgi:hypothetical protein
MSFTYAQLKQAIQDYTDNTETTFVNNLPLFIRAAEERILKGVQLQFFRRNQAASVTSGNKYLACPSDFSGALLFGVYRRRQRDKSSLQFKDVNFIQGVYLDPADTGDPRYYAQFDIDNFIFGSHAERELRCRAALFLSAGQPDRRCGLRHDVA